jgi:hypothetical protein
MPTAGALRYCEKRERHFRQGKVSDPFENPKKFLRLQWQLNPIVYLHSQQWEEKKKTMEAYLSSGRE